MIHTNSGNRRYQKVDLSAFLNEIYKYFSLKSYFTLKNSSLSKTLSLNNSFFFFLVWDANLSAPRLLEFRQLTTEGSLGALKS